MPAIAEKPAQKKAKSKPTPATNAEPILPKPQPEPAPPEIVYPQPFAFSVPAALLRDALKTLKPVASVRSGLPILRTVHIEREDGETRLTATDLDNTLTLRHRSEPPPLSDMSRRILALRHARENGVFCCEIESLVTLLKSVDGGEVIFRNLGPSKQGASELEVPILGRPALTEQSLGCNRPDEFPVFSAWTATSFPLAGEIIEALGDSLPFASTDETRYVLNGIYLDPEKQSVVATDGRTLLITRLPASFFTFPTGLGLAAMIVPIKTVQLLKRGALALAEHFQISRFTNDRDAVSVRIEAGDWTLTSKLIEGNFPNYLQVLPVEPQWEIMLEPKELPRLIKDITRLPALSGKQPTVRQDTMFLSTDLNARGRMRFSTSADAYTESIGTPLKTDGDTIRVGVNREYLLRCFRLGLNHVRLIDAQSPMIFADGVDVGTDGKNPARRRAVVMPIRVS